MIGTAGALNGNVALGEPLMIEQAHMGCTGITPSSNLPLTPQPVCRGIASSNNLEPLVALNKSKAQYWSSKDIIVDDFASRVFDLRMRSESHVSKEDRKGSSFLASGNLKAEGFLHGNSHTMVIPVLAAVVGAAALVYTGYKVGQASDAVQETLKRVNSVLDEIKPRLDAISAKVDQVLQILDGLLPQIAGIVEHSFLKDSLAEAQGIHANLTFYLHDLDFFRKNIDQVIRNCDDLTKSVYKIRTHCTDGVAAFLFSVPAVALWAQAWNLVLKEQKASVRIWDSQFHQDSFKMFKSVFDMNRSVQPRFQKDLAAFPRPDTCYEYSGYANPPFIRSAVMWAPDFIDQYNPGRQNLFSVGRFADTLYSTSRMAPPPEGGEDPHYHPLPGWYWWTADLPNVFWVQPALVHQANTAFGLLLDNYRLILRHMDVFSNADQAEMMIDAARVGPTPETFYNSDIRPE